MQPATPSVGVRPAPVSPSQVNLTYRQGEGNIDRQTSDKDFISYILEGINCGFRVGFDYLRSLSPSRRNMLSTKDHGEVIEAYLAAEVPTGRIIGPLSSSTTSKVKVQINILGVVPKGHASGKWRLITDLSFPEGQSVNCLYSRVVALLLFLILHCIRSIPMPL